jgi:hypothetical protein
MRIRWSDIAEVDLDQLYDYRIIVPTPRVLPATLFLSAA